MDLLLILVNYVLEKRMAWTGCPHVPVLCSIVSGSGHGTPAFQRNWGWSRDPHRRHPRFLIALQPGGDASPLCAKYLHSEVTDVHVHTL